MTNHKPLTANKEKNEKLKAIYTKYAEKLSVLRKKQLMVIEKFMKKIENKKIEEIKKNLNN